MGLLDKWVAVQVGASGRDVGAGRGWKRARSRVDAMHLACGSSQRTLVMRKSGRLLPCRVAKSAAGGARRCGTKGHEKCAA